MPIYITLAVDYNVTRILKDKDVVESIPAGRHEFVRIPNPHSIIRTDPKYRDEKYLNNWLVLKGTTDGLAEAAWLLRRDNERGLDGRPIISIEEK